jgi:PAS domain S-box-containing protein
LQAKSRYGVSQPGAVSDVGTLLHDLQVHQIELEIQNEELRQAKEAIEISRARYVDLYDLAPVGYCTVDAAGRVTHANLTLATLLGVPRIALASQPPFSNFVFRADQDAWYLLRRHVLERTQTQSCELRLCRTGDAGASEKVWVQFCASLTQGGVMPAQLHVAVSDISERKKTEDALRQAKEGAEAASKAKARFLANMSHEIRTPLNAIVGTAHLMRRDGVNPKQTEQLERIDVAAAHLLCVIDDILDLSKIEAGKLNLTLQDVSIADILKRVVSMVSLPAKTRGLRLLQESEHLPQLMRGDPTRLTQALMNYASNAVKFTAQGSVTIRALLKDEDATSQLLRFEVAETGPGIAPDKCARLFTAFEQADASTTRAFGGTGLGLAITRELAHSMGGEVGLSSTPGEGSTFWMTVRLAKSQNHYAGANLADDASGAPP